jgi:hypothetical protein
MVIHKKKAFSLNTYFFIKTKKWPIIIGFVIFYLMSMTGDKGAAQGGQQQA